MNEDEETPTLNGCAWCYDGSPCPNHPRQNCSRRPWRAVERPGGDDIEILDADGEQIAILANMSDYWEQAQANAALIVFGSQL